MKRETAWNIISNYCHPLEPLVPTLAPQLQPLAGIRAVMFDVYGTLLISRSCVAPLSVGDKIAAMISALKTAEIGFLKEEEFVGNLAVQLFDEAVAAHQERLRSRGVAHPEVEILAVWRDVLARLGAAGVINRQTLSSAKLAALALEYECLLNPTWPMPHLFTALEAIYRRGVVFGIVSNAQFYTPLLLEYFGAEDGWHHFFNQQLCIWSHQLLEAKPSKNLLLEALARLGRLYGIAPHETLFVGNDLVNDVAMAHSCGCKTALVALAYSPAAGSELQPDCPDLIVTDYRQLPAALQPLATP